QRHLPTGIDYLTHRSVHGLDWAAVILAEALPLESLLKYRLETNLARAAAAGSACAMAKQAMLLCTHPEEAMQARKWFELAAKDGHAGAIRALEGLSQDRHDQRLRAVFGALLPTEADACAVAAMSAREALHSGDFARACLCVQLLVMSAVEPSPETAELVTMIVLFAEETGQALPPIEAEVLEACLEMRAHRGELGASYVLGRALCGLDVGHLPAKRLVRAINMRKGVAALLRA